LLAGFVVALLWGSPSARCWVPAMGKDPAGFAVVLVAARPKFPS
jgi:hypothetical protein